jgi:hypothetical protein
VRPRAKHWLFLIVFAVTLAALVGVSLWKMNDELTPDQARNLATKLANRAFAERLLFGPAPPSQSAIVLVPEAWPPPVKKDGRWKFEIARPAGPQATVSFDLQGRHAEVHVQEAGE